MRKGIKKGKRYGNNIKYYDEDKWDKVNEENKRLFERFIRGKMALSPKTLTQYKNSLQIFFIWVLEFCDNRPMYELDTLDYLDYQGWMLEQGLAATSIKTKRSAISTLCNFIEVYLVSRDRKYKDFRHIVRGVDSVKGEKKHIKEPLNTEELNFLRSKLKEQNKWQQLAYLEITYDTGARREEIRQLKKEIVYYTPNSNGVYQTHIVRCKGSGHTGERRKFRFSEETRQAILKWLEVRGEDDCEYLFVNKTKNGRTCKQVSETTFNYWCTTIFEKIIGRRVHPHLFRSSKATNLSVESNIPIKKIQKVLGHKSSETTEIYICASDDDDLDDLYI